jgi:hypothetical protein
VDWLQRLPGFTRTAPGLEWALWKKLPWIALVGTALPMALMGLAYLASPQDPTPAAEREMTQWLYIAIGVVVLHWTLVLTAGIGCVIVMLMKGPAFVADGFEVQHSDRPGRLPHSAATSAATAEHTQPNPGNAP